MQNRFIIGPDKKYDFDQFFAVVKEPFPPFHLYIYNYTLENPNPKSKTCFGTPGMFLKVQQRVKLDLALCLNYRSGAARNLGKFH